MKLEGRFWITRNGRNLAGQGRIELLARIADSGSISQAAKTMGMSYKAAWDAVDAMNNAAGEPLVERAVGGKGGGGTRLTSAGQELIQSFRRYWAEHQRFLDRLGATPQLAGLLQLTERLSLHSSARNQLIGRVLAIHPRGLNDLVVFELDGGQVLQAIITRSSTQRLGLRMGVELCALIKASWVHLTPVEENPAENRLLGRLSELRCFECYCEALVELSGGGQLVCGLPEVQVVSQGLESGQSVQLLVDAEQIILCTL